MPAVTVSSHVACVHPALHRYAELFSEHVAFSVRKSTVAATTDMDAVMRYWDEVVQHQDELGGYGSIRTYPYRINEDVQISIGASPCQSKPRTRWCG